MQDSNGHRMGWHPCETDTACKELSRDDFVGKCRELSKMASTKAHLETKANGKNGKDGKDGKDGEDVEKVSHQPVNKLSSLLQM